MPDRELASTLPALRGLLEEGLALWTEMFAATAARPKPGSRAEGDLLHEAGLRGDWGEDPVQQVLAQVQTLSVIAHDQVVALIALLEADSTYGPITIARGAAEASARAWWLLDPGIDVRARVARGMNERLEGLFVSRLLPDDVLKGFDPSTRIDMISAGASQNGFNMVKDRQRVWVSERRPSATQLFRYVFDLEHGGPGQPLHWIMSAVTHGTIGGWVQLMKDPVGGVALSCAAVVFTEIRAVGRQVAYMGWPSATWLEWRKEATAYVLEHFGQRPG